MRILIAGGFGFVGGRLGVHLAKQGHKIVLGTRKSVAPPLWLPTAEVAKIDWWDNSALLRCCVGVDAVILAAGVNAQECDIDPVAGLAFNGLATARMVSAASGAGVRRIIYLSTAHVYASPLVGIITEDTCPRNLHPYATSHLAGEKAVLGASQRGNIEGIVLRLSNAFGAPMDKGVNCWMLLVNDLCRQLIDTQRMVVHSTGVQRRDFITLEDVCCATAHLLALPVRELGNGLFNVGGAWAPTIWEMACLLGERCEAILGFSPEMVRTTPFSGESGAVLDYRLDALQQTGFHPSADRVEEIDQLIKFCSAYLG